MFDVLLALNGSVNIIELFIVDEVFEIVSFGEALHRAFAVLKDTPSIFLTAAVRRHQVEENDGIICDHPCIAKPASVDVIVAAIEKHARQPAT